VCYVVALANWAVSGAADKVRMLYMRNHSVASSLVAAICDGLFFSTSLYGSCSLAHASRIPPRCRPTLDYASLNSLKNHDDRTVPRNITDVAVTESVSFPKEEQRS